MSTGSDDAVAELEAAADRLERLREHPPVDREAVAPVADAYESVLEVLDRWEERATDWDDFRGYVEFREDISGTLESIPEDITESDAFLEADDHVKTGGVSKSLTERDFEAARAALSPARKYAEYREDLEAARERYRGAYRTARHRRRELAERVEDLERVRRLGAADLDAPTERLRDPVTRYNDAVRDTFEAFRRGSPAREFLRLVETAAGYPLVEYRSPPAELLEYVESAPAGENPVPKLLAYAEYSTSKLDHYVEDASLLKRRVATNRTYLEGLSAEPLCVSWPPPEAATLRYRTRELLSVVGRFAGEETTAVLRTVGECTREAEYDRLRDAAVARSELTDEEREAVASGELAAELADTRERLERLEAALEAHETP